jgi:mevalonate kinase
MEECEWFKYYPYDAVQKELCNIGLDISTSAHTSFRTAIYILENLFERPRFEIWERNIPALMKQIGASTSIGTVANVIKKLGDAGLIITPEKIGLKCPLRPTDRLLSKFRDIYSERKAREDKFVQILLKRTVHVITSSPRTVTLLGEYCVTEDRGSAISIAINSRTYVGFTDDQQGKAELYYVGIDPELLNNEWPKEGLGKIAEYFELVQERLIEKKILETRNELSPSIIVITDRPGHLRLNLAGSSMAAFVTGYLKILESANLLKFSAEQTLTTNAGQLARREKELVSEIAVRCEMKYLRDQGVPLAPSGLRSMTSTFGGIIHVRNVLGKLTPTEVEYRNPELPLLILPTTRKPKKSKGVMNLVFQEREYWKKLHSDNKIYEGIYTAMSSFADIGKNCLERNDLSSFGRLMSKQHQMMKAILASHISVDEILLKVETLQDVYGVKITGAGGEGACIIILYDNSAIEAKTVLENLRFVCKEIVGIKGDGRLEELKSACRAIIDSQEIEGHGIKHERGATIEVPSSKH